MGLAKRVDRIATRTILLLFQSAYVLSTKKPGGIRSEARVYRGGRRDTFRASE
jgi:hypothetical protein